VVDRDSWSDGHFQSECFNTERDMDARDGQRRSHAAMDDLQSAVSVFASGCDDSDRSAAYDNLSCEPNRSGCSAGPMLSFGVIHGDGYGHSITDRDLHQIGHDGSCHVTGYVQRRVDDRHLHGDKRGST
jgi:hypothetical protein